MMIEDIAWKTGIIISGAAAPGKPASHNPPHMSSFIRKTPCSGRCNDQAHRTGQPLQATPPKAPFRLPSTHRRVEGAATAPLRGAQPCHYRSHFHARFHEREAAHPLLGAHAVRRHRLEAFPHHLDQLRLAQRVGAKLHDALREVLQPAGPHGEGDL